MSTTQIVTRQIANGAILDAQVGAGANIASSKLADGANFLKKDGSVAMTGNFDFGSQKGVNLTTPTASTDAANKAYVDAQIQMFQYKNPTVAASTANITVSSPGTAVFDGVTLSTGNRLLLKNQTAQAENGIYQFNGSSSALTRVTDMDAWTEVPGALVTVDTGGSTNANTVWLCTAAASGTIGTTAITWTQIGLSSGLTNANFVDGETPSGSINGSNVTFTIANTPVTGSVKLYLNGVRQNAGAGNDYTISGSTITMATAPLTGEVLLADYRK